MWGWIFFTTLAVVVLVALYFQLQKLKRFAEEGKSRAQQYGKNVVAGVVAGTVVIVIDRSLTAIFTNPPVIDYTSCSTTIVTGTAAFITLIWEVGLMLLLIIWIINKGLGSASKPKPRQKRTRKSE